jgi:hypothetical protein
MRSGPGTILILPTRRDLFLNGTILGTTRWEVEKRFDEERQVYNEDIIEKLVDV